jgi:flavorubredoxin
MEDHLAKCQLKVVTGAVSAKWQPKEDDLARCRGLGAAVAKAMEK